jgi:hypothetical protein
LIGRASRGRTALPAALLAVQLAGSLSGCGGGAEGAAAESSGPAGEHADGERAGTPQTVDCPADATAVDLPEEFAAPLPEGTVVLDVQQRDGGRTVVTGVVPAGQKDVLAELQRAYPAAGLTLTEGETEERDAESNFEGDGVEGRWGIRELPDCSPEATRIDVVVRTS